MNTLAACYKIHNDRFWALERFLNKLNNKQKKLKNGGLSYTRINECEEHTWIELTGATPIANGFKLLGKIERGAPDLLYSVPGEEIPHKYYDTDSSCEHCNTDRFRKDLYVLENVETCETIQVGSSCLGDFLRDENAAHDAMRYFEYLKELRFPDEEFDDLGLRGAYTWRSEYSINGILNIAAAVVRIFGWISKAKAEENIEWSTADYITAWIDNEKPCKNLKVTDEDKELSAAAQGWILRGEWSDEYHRNLQLMVNADEGIERRRIGYLCSLIGAYKSELVRREQNANSPDVPEGRYKITGVIVKTDIKYNDFGGRYVMTVKDDRGFMVWGTQPKLKEGSIKTGTRIEFMAKVEKSPDNSKFGFYTRPTKAKIEEPVT